MTKGKNWFTKFKNDEGILVRPFSTGLVITIYSGKTIKPDQLSFAKFCYIIGEINRSNRFKFKYTPSLARKILIPSNFPPEFKYYIHHGIQFGWSNDLRKNKLIYLAIMAFDLIFINIKRNRWANYKICIWIAKNWQIKPVMVYWSRATLWTDRTIRIWSSQLRFYSHKSPVYYLLSFISIFFIFLYFQFIVD